MAQITVLDQETINKIAAGEVIERPSSVVKELLENAIDAGASFVTVEIRDGGISFIRITDNGCGIEAKQIPLAFLRHSTSKIRSAADLLSISSLGFRGEALSSIAAVAQVELMTKTPEAIVGSRYVIEGGLEKSTEEIGVPSGTTFVIRNLFFNTPVRRKFLKTAATEGSYIYDLVSRIALSRPDISIRLIQNGQTKIYTSGNHNLKDIIYSVYGRDVVKELVSAGREEENLKGEGFIGKPLLCRGNRTYENYFINGRYVKSDLITKAIEDAYRPFLMQHKYPFTVLSFTFAPELLDVNVHPSKMELRFQNPEEVYHFVFEMVTEALTRQELIPKVELSSEKKVEEPISSRLHMPEPFETKRRTAEGGKVPESSKIEEGQPLYPITPNAGFSEQKVQAKDNISSALPPISGMAVTKEEKQLDLFEEKILTPEKKAEFSILGQVFKTYWLVQYRDEFLIVDQHAAHEKVLYERFVKDLKEKKQMLTQQINPPIILTLMPTQMELLQKYQAVFLQAGFEIEPFGGKEYAVYGVPADFSSLAKQEWLMEMIDGMSEEGGVKSPDILLDKLASMACKAAVKGNQALSHQEMESLLSQMLALEHPYTCPHGRPTVISMSKYELEKKFKRVL